MSLTRIVEAEKTEQTSKQDGKVQIYSPKLGKYVPLESGKVKGEMQQYNIGIAPGSWY
ncbi:MAG: hypothetical protein AABX39_04805 [Nanoarchaeota archaeon]